MAQLPSKTTQHVGRFAEGRLAELDLHLRGIQDAIRSGEYARMEATDHDPQNAAGLDAYRYRVRALRDTFCPGGRWVKRVAGGLELLLSKDGRRGIITRAGDDGVGLANCCPQPKQQIGETTVRAANANATLALNPDWFNVGSKDRPEIETWMLLVTRRGDTARAELSLPTGLDEEGRALAWLERILLPDMDFSAEPLGAENDGLVEIDVPVARKR